MRYKKIRLNTAICLRSMGLIQIAKKHSGGKNDIKHINKVKYSLNSGTTYSQLSIPWNILNLSAQDKRRVVSILKHYLSKNRNYQYSSDQATYKYLQRFYYKNGKCCTATFQLKNNNQGDKCRQGRADSISALYAIYKALQASNKFSVYRKLKQLISIT